MQTYIDHIVNTITNWQDIDSAPHRFGGVEFRLGNVEIGHIHRHGMVDIPFTRRIRQQLVADGKAQHHHLLRDSGWITYYMRDAADVEQAIWLYRLSYLQKRLTRNRSDAALKDATATELAQMGADATALGIIKA